MTSVINHDVRKAMGISSVHFLVAQTIASYTSANISIDEGNIAEFLGLTQRAVSVSIAEMLSCSPTILIKDTFERLVCTEYWYKSQVVPPSLPIENSRVALSKDVITEFNVINKSKYMVETNYKLVDQILKIYPKLTLDHFKSVIKHKKETWGKEGDSMEMYNRPSTIFRNATKFMGYYEEAQIYWSKFKS